MEVPGEKGRLERDRYSDLILFAVKARVSLAIE
jgi:hypothetical protein